MSLVQGAYPKTLIDQWDKYDSAVGSDNDRPGKKVDVFQSLPEIVYIDFCLCSVLHDLDLPEI